MSPVIAANVLLSADFLFGIGMLAVVLVAGAVVLYATDVWRKRQMDAAPDDSPMTLNHYHELFLAGELTEAEYQKVRDRLTGKTPPVAELPPTEAPPP